MENNKRITVKDLQAIRKKLKGGNYTSYFFLPDFEKPSGGMQLTYNHVKCMNENGFKAKIVHQKSGFKPEWLNDYFEKDSEENFVNIPTIYLDDGKLPVSMEDFFFIPEGFPQLMESLHKQNAPCKRIVFCQNWYYVLNALMPGMSWDQFGIIDCMSVSNSQTEYLKMIFPNLRVKTVVGHIDDKMFTPPEKLAHKKLVVSFIPSRDGGTKSSNVIKTFYALFPHFKFIQFKELGGLSAEEYSTALRESTFYVHFDEYSSWGTAPIEAFLSKCLIAGWDGVGGREYMNIDNMWLAQNGDIMRLALAIGNMIETYIMDDVPKKVWEEMEKATQIYTKEKESESIINVHTEYREERVKEVDRLIEMVKKVEEKEGEK